MNDFTRWLYTNFIKPQLDTADPCGYEQALSIMDTSLDKPIRLEYDKALEFYAGNAFLLGLRTGEGLSRDLMYKHDKWHFSQETGR